MNTLSPLAAKPAGSHPPLSRRCKYYSRCVFSLNVRTAPSSRQFQSAVTTSAQSRIPTCLNNSQNLVKNWESFNLVPLKHTLIATISTAAVILLSGCSFPPRAGAAAPVSLPPPLVVETTLEDSISNLEKEKPGEDQLHSISDDIVELKDAVERTLTSKNFPEAARITDKLTDLEPDEIEWRLLRADLYVHSGDTQLAREMFHNVLKQNPNCLEACQGLVNIDSQDESSTELKKTEERILEAIRLTELNKECSNLIDFELLLAQIRVLDGKYDEALEIYKELEKDGPDDYRIYLCQALVYSLLKNKGEAEVNLEKYRKLVPEGHLYNSYFSDDILSPTKSYIKNEMN